MQIDEHDVLGAFLRIGQKFLLQRQIFLRRWRRGGACRPAGGW